MMSGLNCLILSTVASVLRKIYRFFSLAALASRYFGKSFIRVLLGRSEMKVERPPMWIVFLRYENVASDFCCGAGCFHTGSTGADNNNVTVLFTFSAL